MIKPNIIQFPQINIKKLRFRLPRIHIPKGANLTAALYSFITFALSGAKILGNMTPFGTAFFTAVCSPKNITASFTAMALGSLWAHRSALSLCYIVTGGVVAVMNILFNKKISPSVKAYVTGGVLFAAKSIASVSGGFLTYDLIINFTEAFISGITVFVADKAAKVIFPAKKRTFLSYGETVSTISILALILLWTSSLPKILWINIGNVLGIAVILLLSNCTNSPAGAIAGIIIGAVNSVGTYNAGAVIGAYAFSGLISSLTARFGKGATVLGFILANASITIFINGSTEVLISIADTLAAGVLFYFGEKYLTPPISGLLKIGNYGVAPSGDSMDFAYKDRLRRISESLKILSESFTPRLREDYNAANIAAFINRTAEKACSDCSLRFCCWKKKTKETRDSVLSLMTAAEKNGKASITDVAEELKNRCIRTERLVNAFNDSYEIYRTSRLWQDKLSDCKALSCSQMGNISRILNDMASEKHFPANEETSVAIRSALDCHGYSPASINTYIKKDSSLVAEIKFARKKFQDDMKYLIPSCISDATGVKMRFGDMYSDDRYVYLTFTMRENFCRATGGASIKKDGEKVCGDSFTSMNLPDGTYIAAISDGMGSGEAASKESHKTIELIKSFIRCGFDVMHTVKIINSALMMTGKEDMFSTIDLCSINMHSGMADFIKIGGAATYIKRGKNIEKVTSSSLPAGISSDINPKRFSRQLEDDTVIVMVSDGIENASADSDWLTKRLGDMDTVNPHVLADKILDLALFYGGGKAKDDMTVIATRIWKENV